MQWWEWVTWGVALLSGIGGLVLGIRAELRTHRYRPHWTPEPGHRSMTFHNRTGEDAMNVRFDIAEGWFLANYQPYGAVAANESARFATVARTPEEPAPYAGVLRWVRPSTGREYRLLVGPKETVQALSRSIGRPRRR